MVAQELVPDPVQLVGGDARLHVACRPAGAPARRARPATRIRSIVVGVLDLGPVVGRAGPAGRRTPGARCARARAGAGRSWRGRWGHAHECSFPGEGKISVVRRPASGTTGGGGTAMSDGDYWFCLNHHRVEGKDGCKNADRLGPYATAEEASRALEQVSRSATRSGTTTRTGTTTTSRTDQPAVPPRRTAMPSPTRDGLRGSEERGYLGRLLRAAVPGRSRSRSRP